MRILFLLSKMSYHPMEHLPLDFNWPISIIYNKLKIPGQIFYDPHKFFGHTFPNKISIFTDNPVLDFRWLMPFVDEIWMKSTNVDEFLSAFFYSELQQFVIRS